jgi:uncharacterized delta-60 repeat protein
MPFIRATGFKLRPLSTRKPRLSLESLEERAQPATLTLTIAADQIDEAAGPAATTGTLTRGGMDLGQQLIVNLASNDPTEATVPAQAVFAPGESSIPFDIAAEDDAIVDGDQTVTISGTATLGTGLALDPTFAGGTVATSWGWAAVAGQPDGKVVVAGGGSDFIVSRYNANGTLDTTFGSGGIVSTDITGQNDRGEAVVVQPDGKIVVGGIGYSGPQFDWVLARYNPDGMLDSTFGVGGKVNIDMGPGSYNEVWDLVLQPDGKILAGGNIEHGSPTFGDFAVVRYNTDGTLDTGFGVDGVATTSFGFSDRGFGIALQPDSKIVIAGGSSGGNSNSNFAVARFTPEGVLDSAFGNGGKAQTDIPGSYDYAEDVVVQPDGKIILAGRTSPVGTFPPVYDFVLVRYQANGALDASFGSGGIVVKDMGGDDSIASVGLQADGQILVAGSTGPNKTSTLARFTSAGVFDTSVSAGSNTRTQALQVTPAGRIYVAGGSATTLQGHVNAFTAGEVLSDSDTVIATDNDGSPPVANDDTYSIDEDQTLVVDAPGLLANDSNPLGHPMQAVKVSDPLHGSVVVNTDGSITYTPNADYHGSDSFTYFATTGIADSNTATVTITVDPVNDAPTLDAIPDPPPINDPDPHTVDLTGITAGPNESQTLTVTAVSDNPALVPHPSVDYSSPAAAGTLTFALQPNQAGSATITVTVTDDGGTNNGGVNSFSQTFTVGAVNDAPTLDVIPDPDPVPEDDALQTINLTGISAGGENQTLTVTATSSNPALIPDPTVVYASPGAVGSLRYRPLADQWGSAVITVTVRDEGGTAFGGSDEISRTFTVNVTPQPDAPVIDTGLIPMTAAVPRKPAPINPSGSLVADLVSAVVDVDGDPLGLAVTAVDDLNGTWQYSLDAGANWQNVPTDVSETSALVLTDDPSTRVRFLPARKSFQGFSSFHFKAWDQSDLAGEGTRRDTTLVPTAYSAIERAWVAVGRTKPVVNDTGATVLSPVKEDRKASRVFQVRNLIGIAALEQGVLAKNLGIAVTDLSPDTGTWQYRLAKTKAWVAVGDVSPTGALLLGPKDVVRFVPAADATGRADLRFKTWNQTGRAGDKVDTAGPNFGVDFGFAAIDVTPINDRPVMDLSVPAVLNPVFHTETTNARTLASMMSATDLEGAALGVAVIGTNSKGWEYRPVGGTFTPLPPVSIGKALLLDPATEVRFVVPIDALPGTATLSFKAWDQVPGSGVMGGRAPIRGTAFSQQTEIVTVAITNSPPTLDTAPDVTLPSVALNGTKPPNGVPVESLLGSAVTDFPVAVLGMAVVFADNANGKWQYSLNGRDYFDVGTVGESSALLLSDGNKIRFVPSSPTAGTATIQYKAWDRSTGQVGDRIDTAPPLNSFSLETETAAVNFS